jgi:hypothetical protein
VFNKYYYFSALSAVSSAAEAFSSSTPIVLHFVDILFRVAFKRLYTPRTAKVDPFVFIVGTNFFVDWSTHDGTSCLLLCKSYLQG